MHKSALVAALLVSACSCVTVMAAETVPANSQIFKEAKSLPKVPPEFYRRITDNFKRALEHQRFSNFLIFSLLW